MLSTDADLPASAGPLMRAQWDRRVHRRRVARLDTDATVMRVFLAALGDDDRLVFNRLWLPVTGSLGGAYILGAGLFRIDTNPILGLCLHVDGDSLADWLLATLLLIRTNERRLRRLAYTQPASEEVRRDLGHEAVLHNRLERSWNRAVNLGSHDPDLAVLVASLAVTAYTNAPDYPTQQETR